MGRVYEVEDTALRERVALKTIRPEIAQERKIIERFRREIHLARKVTHPNVCRIFDLGFHEIPAPPDAPGEPPQRALFLTMELLVGESLSQRIARVGRLTPEEALPIVAQLAAGLDAAHAMGIIHRDFKSGNVMLVDWPGAKAGTRAVVTDFGLAHGGGGDDSLSSISDTGDRVGTPAYMAPEQIEGKELTPAADLYALGVVMYEMVTGIRPFEGTGIAVAMKRLSEAPTPPRSVMPDLPPVWESVIVRCLDRDPSARFGSATDVAEALRGRGPVSGGRPSPKGETAAALAPGRVEPWMRRAVRHPLAAVGLLVVAAAAYSLWREGANTSPAVAPRSSATPTAPVTPRRAVAVLSLRNAAQLRDATWLSTAIGEILTTDLGAGTGLRAIAGSDVARAERELGISEPERLSRDAAMRLRANLGADLLVLGAYSVIGGGESHLLRVDVHLQDAANGEVIASGEASGTEHQLSDLVSRAGGPLREKLGLGSASPAHALEVAASLPANRDAAMSYSQGLASLRASDALAARNLLEKAVAADPRHPLPHAALADAWSTLGFESKAQEEAQKALALSGALPQEQRLSIQARLHEISRNWEKAIEAYQSLSMAFPDNVDHGCRLAEAQISAGRPREALLTVDALRKLPTSLSEDPQIDLAQARAFKELADFPRTKELAARAAAKAATQGARLFVARARLLEGNALDASGDPGGAASAIEDARRIYEAAGDRGGLARALNELAILLYERGDLEGARRLLERCLTITREIGDRRTTAVSLNNMANVVLDQGDVSKAQSLYRDALQIYTQIGAKSDAADVLVGLGGHSLSSGDLPGARKSYEEALKLYGEVGHKKGVDVTLTNLAEVLYTEGDLKHARDLHDESLAICREIGDSSGEAYNLYRLGQVHAVAGDLRVARDRYEEAAAIQERLGDTIAASQTRVALAELAVFEGRPAEAEGIARAAEEVLRTGKAADAQALALVVMTQALLAQGKTPDAQKAVRELDGLAAKSEDRHVRLAAARISARVRAAPGSAADTARALRSLEDAAARAGKLGFLKDRYEALLALGELELTSGTRAAGRKRLEALSRESEAKGFGLVARRAEKVLKEQTGKVTRGSATGGRSTSSRTSPKPAPARLP
jgi:tetratricopeptide (TPR) repeat protein